MSAAAKSPPKTAASANPPQTAASIKSAPQTATKLAPKGPKCTNAVWMYVEKKRWPSAVRQRCCEACDDGDGEEARERVGRHIAPLLCSATHLHQDTHLRD